MSEYDFLYYVWVLLLLIAGAVAWTTNFFALPGNWFLLALAALFAWAMPAEAGGPGLAWRGVAWLGALAVGGEVLEFAAGAAGAAKQGASRRAVALALVGTLAGSIAGAVAGLPVPVAGPVIGALLGGAGGAFAGAYLGEMWKHGLSDRSFTVGWGALVGRLLGTIGKLAVGAVMLAVLAVHALS